MLWILLAGLSLVVVVLLLVPLVRRSSAAVRRGDYDLEVYRHQLAEVDADAARGVLSPDEADAARLEVKRRILTVEQGASDSGEFPGWRLVSGAGIAVFVPLIAFGLYLDLGSPSLPDEPLAQRTDTREQVAEKIGQQQQMAALIERLAERLASQPDDVQGWILLARSFQNQERYDEAAGAYRKAAALEPTNSDLYVAIGENLIFGAQGTVTPAAREAFEKALQIDAGNPGAQFYIGLAHAQGGDWQAAYDSWLALAKATPANAPWRSALMEHLASAAKRLGIDLAKVLPKAPPVAAPASQPGLSREDVEAAQQMTTGEQQEMIRSMVARLAEKLKENPSDYEGWMRLGRAYRVLGDLKKSAAAYGQAVVAKPGDVSALMNQATALVDTAGRNAPVPPAAGDIFRRVLEIQPDNRDALWFRGLAESQAGQVDSARATWKKLLAQLEPGSSEHETVKTSLAALPKGAN